MQQLLNSKPSIWLRQRTIYIIYFIGINALNIQSVITDRMNVWKIFRFSYYHFIEHKDIYAFWPKDCFDQYQYSPSFPVMFAPFAIVPSYIGYFIWNNLSMMLMPFVIFKLKGISNEKKCLMCYIALLDMLTCMQGTQTNVMIGVLMVLAFLSFENKQYWIAAFAIAAGAYIKIYPIVAASLFLLYPDKIKFIVRFIVAMIVIGALPLLFLPAQELITHYHNWYAELVIDQGDNYGKISLTGLIQAYFNISDLGKLLVQIAGVFIFCLMYVRYKLFASYNYRLYFLSAILIWVTIFNHASEIYGYAIAIWGVGIWYALQKPSKALNIFMVLFVFFATFLSIDPTPHIILDYIYEHGLKALPFTIMFGVIVWEMLKGKSVIFSLEKEA
jgi:Glycosyltransferase family 87